MRETYSFPSADDKKTPVYAVKWTPVTRPSAVVQLVHGMIEYIDRYEEFAEFLTAKGIVVFGHDHIGHGESVESPEDWGIFHTDRPDEVAVEDMMTNYRIAREQYPDLPIMILGHSMGSFLLREMLVSKREELKDLTGAIIMGTGSQEANVTKTASMVLKVLAKLHGWDYKSSLMAKLNFSDKAYKSFDMTGENPENSWLSTNVESVKKYYSDPKDTFEFSLNGYRLLINSVQHANDRSEIAKMNKNTPILLVSGHEDPVGNMGDGVRRVYQKFKAAGMKDVTIRLYDGQRHEILQEMDRERNFEEIYLWIASKVLR